MTMPIYESAEDYLESILMIEEKKGVVHSVDIAEDRGFSKASVSVAMKMQQEFTKDTKYSQIILNF